MFIPMPGLNNTHTAKLVLSGGRRRRMRALEMEFSVYVHIQTAPGNTGKV